MSSFDGDDALSRKVGHVLILGLPLRVQSHLRLHNVVAAATLVHKQDRSESILLVDADHACTTHAGRMPLLAFFVLLVY